MDVDIGDVINQTSFTHYQPNLQVRFGAPKGHVAVMILLGHADKKAPELFDAKSALRKLGWVEHTELDSARSELGALRDELGAVKGEYDRAVNNVAALREELAEYKNHQEILLKGARYARSRRDYWIKEGRKIFDRLTAAEQRNAALSSMLFRMASKGSQTPGFPSSLMREARLLIKPTEPGASE